MYLIKHRVQSCFHELQSTDEGYDQAPHLTGSQVDSWFTSIIIIIEIAALDVETFTSRVVFHKHIFIRHTVKSGMLRPLYISHQFLTFYQRLFAIQLYKSNVETT